MEDCIEKLSSKYVQSAVREDFSQRGTKSAGVGQMEGLTRGMDCNHMSGGHRTAAFVEGMQRGQLSVDSTEQSLGCMEEDENKL